MTDLQSVDKHDRLREWYLARLRKRALDEASRATALTPLALIRADRQLLEQVVSSKALEPAATFVLPESGPVSNPGLIVCAVVVLLLCQMVLLVSTESSTHIIAICISCAVALILLVSALSIRRRIGALQRFLAQHLINKAEQPVEQLSAEQLASALAARLQRMREQQNLIADFSEDVVGAIDSSFNWVALSPSCNQAWKRYNTHLLGLPVVDLLPETERARFQQVLSEGKEQVGEFQHECTILCGDGSTEIDTAWSVEWSKSQELFFAVVKDVTQRKQIERIKDEFVAIIAHDLRSPITNLRWTFELLQDGLYGHLNDVGLKRLLDANRSIDFLLDMIADLIDLHRIEKSDPELEYATIEYRTLIEESIEAVEAIAEAKDMKLVRHVPEGSCDLDKVRMKRVLINLLSNAIKFSPKSTTITVNVEDQDNIVSIAITDEGPGISPEYLDRLFDRFCNIGNSAARRDGSGLGLFTSKALVEAHTGEIRVQSELGKGTSFNLLLPKSRPEGALNSGKNSVH